MRLASWSSPRCFIGMNFFEVSMIYLGVSILSVFAHRWIESAFNKSGTVNEEDRAKYLHRLSWVIFFLSTVLVSVDFHEKSGLEQGLDARPSNH